MNTIILDSSTGADFLTNHMLNQALKYAAGNRMFCDKCGCGLDYKRTALVETKIMGLPSKPVVMCLPCADTTTSEANMPGTLQTLQARLKKAGVNATSISIEVTKFNFNKTYTL